MFHLREPYVSPIVQNLRPPPRLALVRVGAMKESTYVDSNGKSWTIEESSSAPKGQEFKGYTDAYPDTTYTFYESTEDALTATIERIAKSQALSSSAVDEWSREVESSEGPLIEEAGWLEDVEGASERIDMAAKKKAATAVPKAPPTASGGAALAAIQASLVKLGYDLGKYGPKSDGVDGKMGPMTRGAIMKFKKDKGIKPVDATINEEFRKALAEAAGGKAPAGPGAAAAAGGLGTTGLIIALVAAVAAIGLFFVLRK